MTRSPWRYLAAALCAAANLACTTSDEARAPEPQPEVEKRLPTLDHIAPARDSVGSQPTHFEWTVVEGADRYAIGIWDDVDRVMWRNDRVQGNSVNLPDEIELGFGTYYWSVTALRDDRPIAESGRSVFVVR